MNSKQIGIRIRQAREACGLNRKELASKISVAASTITRYENGEIEKPKIPVIDSIARALDVNPMWLSGKSPYEKSQDMIKSWRNDIPTNFNSSFSDISAHEQELLKKYRALPDPVKNTIDDLINLQYESIQPKVEKDTAI